MAGTTDDEALLVARTQRLALSQTEIGATIRASVLPVSSGDVDPGDLPRITIDTRRDAPFSPPGRERPDLAMMSTLGEGGMGRVHLARQRSLARDVAVKTLKADATPAVAHALLREARITGMLEHPGVIPVHALGVDAEGRPMLVMKRVDGVDLSTKLERRAQTGDALVACLEALMQVCRTCEFAHSRGVLHRDIKPDNIMLGAFGEVYLLDWGIATKLDAGPRTDEPIVGTPVYMAPEMVLGRTLDVRTDVYLIGATLHEVLTGQPRHTGKSMMEVARNAMLSEPFAYGADVPEELARLANRATSRDPKNRPESAAALREDIALFLRHRAARAIADAARERLAALETLLEEATLPAKDVARAYRLVAEARFGLAQSLEQDATSAESKEAMRRCAIAAVDLELRQGHVDTAEALYKELEQPNAALETRLAQARAEQEEKKQQQARLARMDHELDPTHHATRRTVPLLALLGLLLLLGAYLSIFHEVSAQSALGAGVGTLVVLVAGTAAIWRTALTNTFNRRGALLLLASMIAVIVNRAIGVAVGRTVSETFALDLLILATVVGTASITFLRGLWPGVLVLVAGVAAIHLYPAKAALLFTSATFVNMALCVVILHRARRE
jgi:predicted Ser/Thr protein kinase